MLVLNAGLMGFCFASIAKVSCATLSSPVTVSCATLLTPDLARYGQLCNPVLAFALVLIAPPCRDPWWHSASHLTKTGIFAISPFM